MKFYMHVKIEKGLLRDENCMERFRETLEDCHLVYVGFLALDLLGKEEIYQRQI